MKHELEQCDISCMLIYKLMELFVKLDYKTEMETPSGFVMINEPGLKMFL